MERSEHFIEPSTVALAVDGPPLLLLGDLDYLLLVNNSRIVYL